MTDTEKYGLWCEHPKYPRRDWQYDVANGDTQLGYWDWVFSMEIGDEIDPGQTEDQAAMGEMPRLWQQGNTGPPPVYPPARSPTAV